jgi:hypothetical protein
MTAKEQLLREVPAWSEHDAEVALRAVEREHSVEGPVDDAWGDLDTFTARASAASLRRLDAVEAQAGFSWEEHQRS